MATKRESNEPQREREAEGAAQPAAFDASSLPRFGAVVTEGAQPEPEPAPPAPALPQLDESERAYTARVSADVLAAREKVRIAEAVGAAWFDHLVARYGLEQGDLVNADGSVTRNPKAE